VFGIYRTFLALIVVFTHFGGGSFLFGRHAVFGFFCLSGFLMTLLIDGPYKGRPDAFAANRFLRLFPLYWATIALTALAILGFGFNPKFAHPYLGIRPSSATRFPRSHT
jgi:peptidoglycan/LPS O-acetylase OafA/YrhL